MMQPFPLMLPQLQSPNQPLPYRLKKPVYLPALRANLVIGEFVGQVGSLARYVEVFLRVQAGINEQSVSSVAALPSLIEVFRVSLWVISVLYCSGTLEALSKC